jgi:hypothetical protein
MTEDDAYDIYDDTMEGEPRPPDPFRKPGAPVTTPSPARPAAPDIRSTAMYQTLRFQFRQQCATHRNEDGSYGKPCWLCRKPISYRLRYPHKMSFSLDHAIGIRLAPERALDPRNFRPAHLHCNKSRERKLEDERCQTGVPSESW